MVDEKAPVAKVNDACSVHSIDIDTFDLERKVTKFAGTNEDVIEVSQIGEVQQQR